MMQKRLAVLTCQLRKAEQEKETFKVATEKLLQFTEVSSIPLLIYICLASFLIVCLFCCFTSQVNSYGHGRTVSSPNHTFSWASLNKQLTSTSCTYFRL